MSTREEERVWRRRITAVAERYERRIRDLRRWAESLSRERSQLARDRRRLAARVRRLEREEGERPRRSACLDCDLLSRFLLSAVEDAPGAELLRSVKTAPERERRILSLLGAGSGNSR
jgi:hypothetical protein